MRAIAAFLLATVEANPSAFLSTLKVNSPAPSLSENYEALEDQRYGFNVKELDSHAAAARFQADSALVEVKTAEAEVEELDLRNQVLLAKAKKEVAVGKDELAEVQRLDAAVADNKKAIEAEQPQLTESASTGGKMAAEKLFAEKYDELSVWRDQVLQDHHVAAETAGALAAMPYKKAALQAFSVADRYEDAALKMDKAAKGLEKQAATLAKAAGMKKGTGDLKDARETGKAAKAIRDHGRSVKAYADKLHAQAANLHTMVPHYVQQAETAKTRAQLDENPESLLPLRVDPNYAYLPTA